MTKAQAWLEVGRRWAQKTNVWPCLCDEYSDVIDSCHGVVDESVDLFTPPDGSLFAGEFWPFGKNRKERVLAACFLAAIAEVGE